MDKMNGLEASAEKVGMHMKSEIELLGGECFVKKQRSLIIHAGTSRFTCTLDLDISFSKYKEDGMAVNKAKIYLLPEELPAFTYNLIESEVPLPIDYHQHLTANPNIICFCMETKEPPENFAKRLSTALAILDQLSGQVYMN
ncbi:DUF1259 domain-containing protein [Planococcus sp. YIM B11945]|uniref:DUF1259 domain-containing protein n=1 Tax=Planococcus sp. YIM B11945 TaxID=3435410 RepID=UPI003D7DCEF6